VRFFILIFILLSIWTFHAPKRDWHINRNDFNKLPVGELKLVEVVDGKWDVYKDKGGRIWLRMPDSSNFFHQPSPGEKFYSENYPHPNVKFLSLTGINGFLNLTQSCYEAILQPDGTYLTVGKKRGTYNYCHPGTILGFVCHCILDVLPHLVNDNYK